MLVDLHIHTKASDGTWDRHELIERLMQNNIGLFSITDHDTIENSEVMTSELEGSDLKYLKGVEVSCTHMRREHHIVAYGFDTTNSVLLRLLEQNQKERSRTQDNLMRWLATVKPQVSYSKYTSYQHERKRGGWKSLNFLLDEGVVKNLSEYATLFNDPTTKFTFQHPQAVIQVVKQAQGIPFLAHPSWHFDGGRMPEKEQSSDEIHHQKWGFFTSLLENCGFSNVRVSNTYSTDGFVNIGEDTPVPKHNFLVRATKH